LEESLLEFPGAILLITHDRYLLDKISTKVLYFSGDGKIGLFEDYYQCQINHLETKKRKSGKGKQKKITKTKIRKLSYKEQLELSQMEEKIQKLEEQLDTAAISHASLVRISSCNRRYHC
jgi:ATP-binding cassette subfamily F protein uup